MLNKLLVGAIIVMGFSLLIWLRFSGQVKSCLAVNVLDPGSEIARGEIMTTDSGEMAKFELCDGTVIYLDNNTQVQLVAYGQEFDPTELKLIQGRVLVDGLAGVTARNARVETTDAVCEIIHYSWLDEIDVTPLAEQACAVDGETWPALGSTTKFETYSGRVISSQPFNPATSSAKTFYDWTGLELENL